MQAVIICVFVLAGGVLIAGFLFLNARMPSPTIWAQCKVTGVPVTFGTLARWKRTKVDERGIILGYLQIRKACPDVSLEDLAEVAEAGGQVVKCTAAMIMARRAELDVSWDEIVRMDREGLDPFTEIKRVVNAEPEDLFATTTRA